MILICAILGRLGALLGLSVSSEAFQGQLQALFGFGLGCPEGFLGRLEAIFEASWAILRPSWAVLEPSWRPLGSS